LRLTSLALHLVALNGRRSQTIGSKVFADFGRVRRVEVAAPVQVLAEVTFTVCEPAYVVLSWRGAMFGREVEGMVLVATEAKARDLVLRKDVCSFDAGRAPFKSGRNRCIEGAATVTVPRPEANQKK
jgi:hypothetical protein